MSVQVPLSCSGGVVGQTGWLVSLTRQPHPPTVPLSLITSLGTPRRLVKRAKAFKNVSVSSTQAISKCTARVSKQVKKAQPPLLSWSSASLNSVQRTSINCKRDDGKHIFSAVPRNSKCLRYRILTAVHHDLFGALFCRNRFNSFPHRFQHSQ